MLKKKIDAVVFDMAGTTVRDHGAVRNCILAAARETGIETSREGIQGMMGWSKRRVFETLWRAQIGEQPAVEARVEQSYQVFRTILERHFETEGVEPTPGCLETFEWLRREGIPIVLTTGFYRRAADIILRRLGWKVGPGLTVRASISGDEVAHGRPAPDMILRAMETLRIADPRRVVNIGDTASDLESGRAAGVGWNLAVTTGGYSREQLEKLPNDGLLDSLRDLRRLLNRK